MRNSTRRTKSLRRDTDKKAFSAGKKERVATVVTCLLLAAIVWIVFGRTLGYDFVNYDDHEYVYENPMITRGLTFEGMLWAFTHVHSSNWHPLTTMSHMLDCSLYGLNPSGHHLTNVLLHCATVIVLFLALLELTGARWPSVFVAALFAIHPLRVESVAWVSERKDVLSGLFFVLILWRYAQYVRRTRPSFGRYAMLLGLFALGLMCKPTLVTVPFILLLLDYWPLRRFAFQSGSSETVHDRQTRPTTVQSLLIEKIPFFVLSGASSIATLFAQEKTISTLQLLSFGDRIANAAVSYIAYVGQMIWPAGLSVFYPYPEHGLPIMLPILAFLGLLITSVVLFIAREKYPFLWIGWLWFLGMLVPMIGLVQVGGQARADRYTYLSQIGLYIMIAWGATAVMKRWPQVRPVLLPLAIFLVIGLTATSFVQASVWKNSETLWNQALAHTTNNYVAHNNLGGTLIKEGRVDEATEHCRKALEAHPNYADAHTNMGHIFASKHEWAEASAAYEAAIQAQPTYAKAHNSLAVTLAALGKTNEAIGELHEALGLNPDYVDAHYNLATVLLRLGRQDEAIIELRELLRLRPGDASARAQLRKLGMEQ